MKSKKTDHVKQIQDRSIPFATKGVGVTNKSCSQSFTNTHKILTKIRASWRKLKVFKCPKTKFEANKTTPRNPFMTDLSKVYFDLKFYKEKEVETPRILRVLRNY